MSYAGSGSGTTQTPDERRAEANRILKILSSVDASEQMTIAERKFFTEIWDDHNPVSPKQLWWLRDLKAKYAE